MDAVKEISRAKLNLSLDVLSRREDGYHDLKMVMCSVDFGDDVIVSLRTDEETVCSSNLPWLPQDSRNLAVKAVDAFFETLCEKNPGVDITLVKRIPVGAGMGGGSANAAAVLRALNHLTGAGLDTHSLCGIGLKVGSDVPYCIVGGNALAEGRGEILTALPPTPSCSVVICKPSFSVSTADLYREIDSHLLRTHPDTSGLIEAMKEADLSGIARRMYNVFEEVLPRSSNEIRTIRNELLDLGALGAVMTGTGSAVFGLFDDQKRAAAAFSRLRGMYRDCFITQIHSESVLDH